MSGLGTADRWFRPRSLDDASELAAGNGARLVAGGCEIAGRRDAGLAPSRSLIDLQGVAGLGSLDAHPKKGLRVGALTTIRQVSNHLWIAKRWAALHEAAEQFSSPQARNTATVVGNVCAGVAHYDMATALLALRAKVQVYRRLQSTLVELADFYRTSGQPDLEPGDIVTGIVAPPPEPDAGSAFHKIQLPQRHCDGLLKFSTAASIALDGAGETIMDATVVIGCCGPAPFRARATEDALLGRAAVAESFERAGQISADSLPRTSDIDHLEGHRRRLARVLVRDVIEQAVSRARSKHNPFDDASDLLRDQR